MSDPELSTVAASLRAEIQRGMEELRNQVARDQSPWMSANSAARRADCSASAIFKAAAMGLITRYETPFAGPRFKREEIDALIENSKPQKRKCIPNSSLELLNRR
jgi:hypothetical protein